MRIVAHTGCNSIEVGVVGEVVTRMRFPGGLRWPDLVAAQLGAVLRKYPHTAAARIGVPAFADSTHRERMVQACWPLEDRRVVNTTSALVGWLAVTGRFGERPSAVVDLDGDHVSVAVAIGGRRPRVLAHEGRGLDSCSLFHGREGALSISDCFNIALAACCEAAGVPERDLDRIHVVGRSAEREQLRSEPDRRSDLVELEAGRRCDALGRFSGAVDDVSALAIGTGLPSGFAERVNVVVGRGAPLPSGECVTYLNVARGVDPSLMLCQGGAGRDARFRPIRRVHGVGKGTRFELCVTIDEQELVRAELSAVEGVTAR